MKFWLPPSLPCTYRGRASAAFSFLPTEPATVRLLSMNGIRTDTPTPMSALKTLSSSPSVRTTITLAQPPPHPPQLPDQDRRERLVSLISRPPLAPRDRADDQERLLARSHLIGKKRIQRLV